jgi:hypothetical protein
LSFILDHDDLTQFGQRTMLEPEQAETVLRGGAMILPEADFFEIFPEAEVNARTFPRFPGQWLNAPAEMQARKKNAVALAVTRHYEALDRERDAAKAAVAEAAKAATAEAAAPAAPAQLATAAAPVDAAPVTETEKEVI